MKTMNMIFLFTVLISGSPAFAATHAATAMAAKAGSEASSKIVLLAIENRIVLPGSGKVFRQQFKLRTGVAQISALVAADSTNVQVSLANGTMKSRAIRLNYAGSSRPTPMGTRTLTFAAPANSTYGPGKLVAKLNQVSDDSAGSWKSVRTTLTFVPAGYE